METSTSVADSSTAAVMKLVTTFAALDLLGPAYTWPTRVLSEAAVRDGVLAGHLYLQGSGDPQLASEHVWQLLRQLPFALTAGCAIVSAVFALIAGRKD